MVGLVVGLMLISYAAAIGMDAGGSFVMFGTLSVGAGVLELIWWNQ